MNKEYYPLYIVIPAYIAAFVLTGFMVKHIHTLTGSLFWGVVLTIEFAWLFFFVTLLAIMRGIKYEDKNKETIYPLTADIKDAQEWNDRIRKDIKRNSELSSHKDFNYKDNKKK